MERPGAAVEEVGPGSPDEAGYDAALVRRGHPGRSALAIAGLAAVTLVAGLVWLGRVAPSPVPLVARASQPPPAATPVPTDRPPTGLPLTRVAWPPPSAAGRQILDSHGLPVAAPGRPLGRGA